MLLVGEVNRVDLFFSIHSYTRTLGGESNILSKRDVYLSLYTLFFCPVFFPVQGDLGRCVQGTKGAKKLMTQWPSHPITSF